MSAQKQHKSLIDKYKDAGRVAKKYGLYGGIIQFSIIMVAFSSKHVFLDHYKVAFPALICLSLYLLVKDFLTSLRIEKSMIGMILEGVELERRYNALNKYFHALLKSFNFTNVLIQRSLINVLALCSLGYLIFQFIGTEMPDIKVSRWALSIVVWIPSVIACKLYYDVLKTLDEAKENVFSKAS